MRHTLVCRARRRTVPVCIRLSHPWSRHHAVADPRLPARRGALQRALAEGQARQAVTLAAVLRYPTELDAGLVALTGAGGTGRLDWITGADTPADPAATPPARTRGTTTCGGTGTRSPGRLAHLGRRGRGELGGLPARRPRAGAAAAGRRRGAGAPDAYRRLLAPGEHDRGRPRSCATPTCSPRSRTCTRAELPDLLAPSSGRPG